MRKPGVKAFIIYNKKLLFILRDNNPNIPYPNTWGLPGGGIEEKETPEEALRRELIEEISIYPLNNIYLGKQIYDDDSVVYRYLIKLEQDEYENIKLGDEGQKLDFFTIEEIKNLELSGYFKQYFLKHFDQIKRLIEQDQIVNSKLLGLEYSQNENN